MLRPRDTREDFPREAATQKVPMDCSNFSRGFFTLLTILAIGGTLAIFITAFVILSQYSLLRADDRITGSLIAIMVFTFILLLLSVYIICDHRPCTRWVVMVLFAVFAAGMLMAAFFLLAFRGTFLDALADLWKSSSETDEEVRDALQRILHCCGWTNACTTSERTCRDPVTAKVNRNANVAGSLLLILGVVLIGGVIGGIKILVGETDKEKMSSQLGEPLMPRDRGAQQLTYGW
jgi:glucan phosphoethanolaminetransferase (alkaline phosphatase superfamily)